MGVSFLKLVRKPLRYWYLPLIVGFLFLILSVLNFLKPEFSISMLALLFALSFILVGAIEIVMSLTIRRSMDNWGWFLALGILTTLIGFHFLVNMENSFRAMVLMVGILILFRSVAAIVFSFDIKNYGIRDWFVPLMFGGLGIAFAFLLVVNENFAENTLVFLTGCTLAIIGFMNIFMAFELKRISRKTKGVFDKFEKRIKELEREIEDEWW